MIIKKTSAHRRNMIVVAILAIVLFLLPLYFLGGPKDKLFVYSFIFLPFALYFSFLFLLMRLTLNDKIEITPDGLSVSRMLKKPVPWSELKSASINYIHVPRSTTKPLLIIIFRNSHIEPKPFLWHRKDFPANEEISVCALVMMTHEPEEIVELINKQINSAGL